jgi:quercetin dioxygenase-like cupin family protein
MNLKVSRVLIMKKGFASIIADGLTSASAGEAQTKAPETEGVIVTILARRPLTDAKGKEVTIATIDYAPGAASPPHRHPGSAFSCVLEGTIENQFGSEMPTTSERGQMWSEMPMVIHHFARNASATQPARTLVFLVTDVGQNILLPPT